MKFIVTYPDESQWTIDLEHVCNHYAKTESNKQNVNDQEILQEYREMLIESMSNDLILAEDHLSYEMTWDDVYPVLQQVKLPVKSKSDYEMLWSKTTKKILL